MTTLSTERAKPPTPADLERATLEMKGRFDAFWKAYKLLGREHDRTPVGEYEARDRLYEAKARMCDRAFIAQTAMWRIVSAYARRSTMVQLECLQQRLAPARKVAG
jgi:hypothetical protein